MEYCLATDRFAEEGLGGHCRQADGDEVWGARCWLPAMPAALPHGQRSNARDRRPLRRAWPPRPPFSAPTQRPCARALPAAAGGPRRARPSSWRSSGEGTARSTRACPCGEGAHGTPVCPTAAPPRYCFPPPAFAAPRTTPVLCVGAPGQLADLSQQLAVQGAPTAHAQGTLRRRSKRPKGCVTWCSAARRSERRTTPQSSAQPVPAWTPPGLVLGE